MRRTVGFDRVQTTVGRGEFGLSDINYRKLFFVEKKIFFF